MLPYAEPTKKTLIRPDFQTQSSSRPWLTTPLTRESKNHKELLLLDHEDLPPHKTPNSNMPFPKSQITYNLRLLIRYKNNSLKRNMQRGSPHPEIILKPSLLAIPNPQKKNSSSPMRHHPKATFPPKGERNPADK